MVETRQSPLSMALGEVDKWKARALAAEREVERLKTQRDSARRQVDIIDRHYEERRHERDTARAALDAMTARLARVREMAAVEKEEVDPSDDSQYWPGYRDAMQAVFDSLDDDAPDVVRRVTSCSSR